MRAFGSDYERQGAVALIHSRGFRRVDFSLSTSKRPSCKLYELEADSDPTTAIPIWATAPQSSDAG